MLKVVDERAEETHMFSLLFKEVVRANFYFPRLFIHYMNFAIIDEDRVLSIIVTLFQLKVF